MQILRLDEGSEDTEAKSYEFVLGTGDAIPDVEEAIKSLEPGQSSAFAVTMRGGRVGSRTIVRKSPESASRLTRVNAA